MISMIWHDLRDAFISHSRHADAILSALLFPGFLLFPLKHKLPADAEAAAENEEEEDEAQRH